MYINVDFWKIDCNTLKLNRTNALNDFKKMNNIAILINVQILNESIYIPECDSVFITQPSDNMINIVQRMCRANRITSIEQHCNIYLWCRKKKTEKILDYIYKNTNGYIKDKVYSYNTITNTEIKFRTTGTNIEKEALNEIIDNNKSKILEKNMIKKTFSVQNKVKYNFKIIFNEYPKIFDDEKLNKIMIDSLLGSDARIVAAISYYFKDNICVIDGKWYMCEDFYWIEFMDMSKLINKFIKLYKNIEVFIINNKDMLMEERQEAIYIINFIKDNLMKPSKIKNIIPIIKNELTKDEQFDKHNNLIAFKNGVYDLNKLKFRKELFISRYDKI